MDIVLNVLDTLAFDKFYATAFPRHDLHNATAAPYFGRSPVEIDVVSSYCNILPSQDAYLSQLDRENTWRQLFSLFLITW